MADDPTHDPTRWSHSTGEMEGDKTATAATTTELSVPPHQLLEQASKMSVSSGQEAKDSRAKLNRLREESGFEDSREKRKQEAFVSEIPESAG